MRIFFLVSALSVLPLLVSGQDWNAFSIDDIRGDRRILPKTAFGFSVAPEELRTLLFTAPHERTVSAEQSPVSLFVPLPDGSRARFHIVGYDLSANPERFPGIKTWYGMNPDKPGQTIFLDWTSRGFHASISGGGQPAVYIDPLQRDDLTHYQVYHRQELPEDKAPFNCSTTPAAAPNAETEGLVGDCALRLYSLAVSATPQYSNYHGATSVSQVDLVHSAVVTTINRVNQVYTRDISLRLQLVENNERLYFFGEADNPFTDNEVSTLLNQNTAIIDGIIGEGNYNLGHAFTQGANDGVARLRSGCSEFWPGAGATRLMAPEGDVFDVDYVAHEMGHQLGANHTQNNNCNYSSSSGMEPGSGSTIMGYAGICPPNVQSNSDGYFHGRSVQEITLFLEIGEGGNCATVINTSLTTPTLTGDPDHIVPVGTPLQLRASAQSDGNLTHNWEQYDVEQALMPPVGTSTQGPLFRSFTPTTDTFRYAPSLLSILSGFDPVWEETPQTGREIQFRMTTRNVNAAYGCAAEIDVVLDVDGDHGPFVVTDPANANQWSAGQTAQVRWDVAGTDASAFASPTVDILITTDNGQSFTTLATGVPNNGFSEVSAPIEEADNARILVRSSGNVFYNVSPQAFTIGTNTGQSDFAFEALSPLSVAACFTVTDTIRYAFMANSSGGASDIIRLQIDGLPDEVEATFSPDSIRPGGSFILTVSGLSGLSQDIYNATITGDSREAEDAVNISFTKLADEPGPGPDVMGPTVSAPNTRPKLIARANGVEQYEFQLAATPDFTDLLYSSVQSDTTFALPGYLDPMTRYFWRVRSRQVTEGCAISLWSPADFVTGPCYAFTSATEPRTISNSGPPQLAEIGLDLPIGGDVLDVDVTDLNVSHSFVGDLILELISPAGTSLELVNRSCGSNNNLRLNFDDEGEDAALPCPPVAPTRYLQPLESLSAFDGESVSGNWTLRATDMANQDGGSLNSFGLVVCVEDFTLPVTFLEFSATGQKDDILLNWATENESDNLGFYVERTTNTAGNWTDLGFVAAGTDYSFTDATALRNTDYFYRLRQTDLDGRVNYSPLRSARIGGAAGQLFLFPNPTEGLLSFRRTGTEPLDFRLTDVSGRLLQSGTLRNERGTLDLGGLPAGLYFLRTRGRALKIIRR